MYGGNSMKKISRSKLTVFVVFLLAMTTLAPAAGAQPDQETDNVQPDQAPTLGERDPSAELEARDEIARDPMTGPRVNLNIRQIGRGERLEPDATTDVWASRGYAYTGTFSSPCGGEPDGGIFVWDVRNPTNVSQVGFVASPDGSRSNDVKAARMRSGNVMVHSNEPCDGGPGGFEIYNVDDPSNPEWLASVRIDELNAVSDAIFGGITDVGVHNLWLFRQGRTDYVGVVAQTAFDNFMIFDITDPTAPELVSAWGAEELFDPGVGDLTDVTDPDGRVLDAALWLLDGFGASANRFLHDVTITRDGTKAYLSNWDAGLVLLDISDVYNPTVISVAIDETSEDGEVNSHAAWPNRDGSIVVEGEEDFSPYALQFSITDGDNAGEYEAAEGSIGPAIADLPDRIFSGPTTYVGLGCEGDTATSADAQIAMPPAPTAESLALIQRGECAFSLKGANAAAAGYAGMVVFNDEARGDGLVVMGGDPVDIPGVFVGHSTGLAIVDAASAADLVIGADGAGVAAEAVADGWSGFRVWDYSDPANPVLASIINTVCSANPDDSSCDPAGTYSAHNVVVETRGSRTVAYMSWYFDGVLVYDITDPYNPVEIAQFSDDSAEFQEANGGPQDIWGIYKGPAPWIYASDRNGGLYVLRIGG